MYVCGGLINDLPQRCKIQIPWPSACAHCVPVRSREECSVWFIVRPLCSAVNLTINWFDKFLALRSITPSLMSLIWTGRWTSSNSPPPCANSAYSPSFACIHGVYDMLRAMRCERRASCLLVLRGYFGMDSVSLGTFACVRW